MVDNDKEKKEKQQAYLRAFNHYFPAYDRNSGVIKQIKEDLERIKKINDLEEKYRKAHLAWIKHHDNEAYAEGKYRGGNLSELGISHLNTIEKYRKLVKGVWDLNAEIG